MRYTVHVPKGVPPVVVLCCMVCSLLKIGFLSMLLYSLLLKFVLLISFGFISRVVMMMVVVVLLLGKASQAVKGK